MSYICAACIGEPFLRALVVAASSNTNSCDYCDESNSAVEIWFIAEKCNEVLATFYEISSETIAVLHFDRTPTGADLETTVQQLAQVPDAAAEDITAALHNMWYDRDSGEREYVDDDPWFVLRSRMNSPLSRDWAAIEKSLRREARYLNPKVGRFMESIFGGIAEDLAANGLSVLVDAGPGSALQSLFRARVFQSEDNLSAALQHPERFLGTPVDGAWVAGRMSATGQPAFYGSTEIETALAEVRPPVGSWVVVAEFSVVRPLKLLDLTLLAQVQLKEGVSLFDPDTEAAAHRRDFLRLLSERMVAPVMPENQDHSYLITQVVADYLAMHPRATIDGIVYPSVQSNDISGSNVVLFNKVSVVKDANKRKATARVELWSEEEDGPRYQFKPTISYYRDTPSVVFQPQNSLPEPALELVRQSIDIHRVCSVSITTEKTSVSVFNLEDRYLTS